MKARLADHPGEVVLELKQRDEALLAAGGREVNPSQFRIKRILVPIDFSACARKALHYAIPLAKQHQAAITLLYVAPSTYVAGEYGRFDYGMLEADLLATGD